MDGRPIDNGAVVVAENRIVAVGRFGDIKTQYSGEIVDLGEQVLLPGLINAHCHLDYTCLRGKIPPQKTFTDWIRAINAEKAELSPRNYLDSINEGFAEAKRFGTTTIANLTGFPELILQITPPIRTWWFAELIDLRAPERANEIVDSAIKSLGRARSEPVLSEVEGGAPWGLAPHALFTASKDIYRRCEEIARRDNVLLTTHLAESREEMKMFREASGPLYAFLKRLGRPMDDCRGHTPLGLFLGAPPSTSLRTGSGRALPDWIVAHLNELTESDLKLLKKSNSRFHVVHSPRSHDYFKHGRFPFERLHSLGFNISLGTDSLASNQSLSLFAEMRAFQKEFPTVSAEEILQMVTVNPAMALHQHNMLGRIRPGFYADLIALRCGKEDNLFEKIVASDGSIDWIMVNGKM